MAIGLYQYEIDTSIVLERESCCNCGVQFAIDTDLKRVRLRDRKDFWCPNGHAQHYTGKTEEQKLKEELERARDVASYLREDIAQERKQHAATKGKVTKLRNRAERGVCSDCHRTFANYAKHQADVHGVENGWRRKK